MQEEISSEQFQKYVRLPGDEIIIFSRSLDHLTFKHLNPVTAGLCIVDSKKKEVYCSGISVSLDFAADEKVDTRLATIQIFGN